MRTVVVALTVKKRLFSDEVGMTKTVMIVDDSASLRQVVKMALTGAGYNVLEAADGKAALAMLDGRQVNMVVCDVNMPIMNGIEFVKEAKKLAAYKFMPILMLTTESQEAKKEEGKAAGAKAWMVKPFSPTQLVSAVGKLCV
jgi:two-component system chemotaxis response regulator CheY